MSRFHSIAALLLSAIATLCSAQGTQSLEERLASTDVRSQQLGEGLHVLFGVGGNIAASIGEQGVLIVDAQFVQMVPKYRAEIRRLGGGDVAFAINTHWHFDHADGNQVLGPEGTWLVAQQNSREMLTRNNMINLVSLTREQAAYPFAALPVVTFRDRMQLHFNGEQIDLLHFGPAHTTGDAAVIFRAHNAVHMGDVFNNSGYPFIDADNGGRLDGVIAFCEAVLHELDESAVVIPGHGPVATYSDLVTYVAMLGAIRDRMARLIGDGATLEQVVAARPTAEWDAAKGDPTSFINRAYTSLSRP